MNTIEHESRDDPEETQETCGGAETGRSEAMTPIAAILAGASDAKAAVEAIPSLGNLLSKTVYGTFYYASYGVVFGALTVAHLIPTDNIMGAGLREGAKAAREAFERRMGSAAQAKEEPLMEDGSLAGSMEA